MKTARRARIAAASAVFLTGVFCAHADRILDSEWNAGLEGWTAMGPATVTNSSGYLEVIFPAQTAPENSYEILTSDLLPGYRPNYVSFSLRAPTFVPSSVRVYLQSSTGRSWYKTFSVSGSNEWLSLNSVVEFESGWIHGPVSTKEQFESDMNYITKVSLALVRSGTYKVHQFDVDEFVVDAVPIGADLPEDNDGDGMLDNWEVAYGFDPGDAADALLDADSDGLSNYDEYVAGTDPTSAASVFQLTMPEELNFGPEPYITIAWPSAPGRVYQVWKSTNLVSGFFMLEGGILATLPVNFYMDELTESERSVFYRIEIE